MSIGLPAHLRNETVSRAFSRGLNTVSFSCFVIAMVAVLSLSASQSGKEVWPAAFAVLPMLITVWMANYYRTVVFTVAHLLIGAPATYWFALTVISQLYPMGGAGQFLIFLPAVALMLVGGTGRSIPLSILWCTIGLVVAESATALAGWQLSGTLILPRGVFILYLAVIVVLITLQLSQRGVRRVQSQLHRAARDDALATLRYDAEASSAALMHDTVLGHLAAIANAPPGAIDARLQGDISRDLEVIVGQEWLSQAGHDAAPGTLSAWQDNSLFVAITEVRAMDLQVEVTGDLASLSRLDARAAAALGPAVKQCLVNVIKHSGAMQAEVAVFAADDELSVLVVDAGTGFDQTQTPPDRLGLRQSVERRIQLVNGSVQVWSTPGFGTSVMIRVPLHDAIPATPMTVLT
ncbi:MAG: sensor histidine kinase [Rhodoglobus sp.]